jgi:thioredoxin 1
LPEPFAHHRRAPVVSRLTSHADSFSLGFPLSDNTSAGNFCLFPEHFSLRFQRGFLMSEHIHYVTDDNFATEVLQSQQPVLVDYWAEWCGPCKMIAPILDEVAKDYAGKLKVAKLNIDDNQKTPAQYGIRGIPTLMLFKGGNIEATKVGALSKGQLTAFIDSNL